MSMHYVVRLADSITAASYPLPVSQAAVWQQTAVDQWTLLVPLPALPASHIVVPSFVTLSSAYRFRFHLNLPHLGAIAPLAPVPATEADKQNSSVEDSAAAGCVTQHIDCWHTAETVVDATVRLDVTSKTAPEHYLAVLSVRPIDLDPLPKPRVETPTLSPTPVSISQMQAEAKIRQRICSPTALAMALSRTCPLDWEATVAACLDPLTNAYGSWPVALHWASVNGCLGAVETLIEWADIIRVLRAGTPLVCSIRFAKGELSNAALDQTGGHLVTLYGVDADTAYIADPAGATDDEVLREYKLEEFNRAWLARRGASYVFCGA